MEESLERDVGEYSGPRVRVLAPGVSGEDLAAIKEREADEMARGISCSGCGEKGHNLRTCPKRGRTVAAPAASPPPRNRGGGRSKSLRGGDFDARLERLKAATTAFEAAREELDAAAQALIGEA